MASANTICSFVTSTLPHELASFNVELLHAPSLESATVICTAYLCMSTSLPNNSAQITIGTDLTGKGSYYTTFGTNANGRVYNYYPSNATWTRDSDERLKKDIQTNTDCGLDFIKDLRTVTYKWKAPSEMPQEFTHYKADQTEAVHKDKMYGFIAQEVKSVLDKHNITDFNGWTVDEKGVQGISYEMFVMPLIKAVQELSAKNDALESRLASLEGS